jgi:hypothetical protein
MLRRRDVLAAGVLLPAAAKAAASPQTDPPISLVGAWSLIEAVTIAAAGRVSAWLGRAKGSGLIVYEATGMMSVQIASARQPLPHETDFLSLSDAQRLPYLDSYYAYFGRYEFDPASSTVTHFVEASLYPNEVGMTLKRTVALSGNVVTLTTPSFPDGSHNVLRWSRITSRAP